MWSQFNVKVRGPWSRNEEFLTFSEWSEEAVNCGGGGCKDWGTRWCRTETWDLWDRSYFTLLEGWRRGVAVLGKFYGRERDVKIGAQDGTGQTRIYSLSFMFQCSVTLFLLLQKNLSHPNWILKHILITLSFFGTKQTNMAGEARSRIRINIWNQYIKC